MRVMNIRILSKIRNSTNLFRKHFIKQSGTNELLSLFMCYKKELIKGITYENKTISIASTLCTYLCTEY